MSIVIRQAGAADTQSVYQIFHECIVGNDVWRDRSISVEFARRHQPIFAHLARTAEHFWLAEDDGVAVGYARTTLRDGVRQLTEFYVLPYRQAEGVGRALLERSFPADGAGHRTVLASTSINAVVRYLKAGVYPSFPRYFFSRPPEMVRFSSDLTFEPAGLDSETIAALAVVDLSTIGYRRDADHEWLLNDRQGYLYRRGGDVVGYGFVGSSSGPFALLSAADFPAVLAHAESDAARRGLPFGVGAPAINRSAIDYMLARGFKLDAFFEFYMSDAPLGDFSRYIFTDPAFFS